MKTLAYASWAVTAAVGTWYLIQGVENPHPLIPAVVALSLGAGMAFLTAHGVRQGRVRMRRRHLERRTAPRTFWVLVAFWYAISALLIGGGVWYLVRG